MLLLKGNNGKSRVVNDILNTTSSICFVYNEYPLFKDGICLNSGVHTLEQLKECIIEEVVGYQEFYDYLIIYTNQTEDNLKDFIDWLNSNPPIPYHIYGNIIVTCK